MRQENASWGWRRVRRMGPACRAGVAALAWGVCLHGQVWAAGEPVLCAGVPAAVQTRQPQALEPACAGARDAFAFLAPLHPPPLRPLLIELVAQLPPDLQRDAVGFYAPRLHRLMVLELPTFMVHRRWFGVPTSLAMYRSVVAHEVVHALVNTYLNGRYLANAGHEYVAYVAMFATMEAVTRQAVMAAMPDASFSFDSEINDMRYALDPMSFGVASYRHWLRQPDGMQFLRRVIEGSVVPELQLGPPNDEPEPTPVRRLTRSPSV